MAVVWKFTLNAGERVDLDYTWNYFWR